jgi:tetraacyldisaccharide 4'-kinase
MPILKILLWPFTVLYNLVMKVRNYLYDIGHKPSFQFDTVVICVGNLNVGGSGKTPMIEYLVRLLSDTYSLAVLSRGYGRKTKGIRLANDQDDAFTLGDEPYQYYHKFGKKVTVCVGEERALAIPTILLERPTTQVILLDDAFQHRTVVPQFSILLTEFSNPFYSDFVMPFGRLRESRSGAKRADAIIITKCKELGQRDGMTEKVQRYAGDKPVFFSGLEHKEAEPFAKGNMMGKKVMLVSGIANSAKLEEFVSSQYQLVQHFKFGDHHPYTPGDIKKIEAAAKAQGAESILTTEKDMVKLISAKLRSLLDEKSWFYLPVETVFVNRGSEFDELVLAVVEGVCRAKA